MDEPTRQLGQQRLWIDQAFATTSDGWLCLTPRSRKLTRYGTRCKPEVVATALEASSLARACWRLGFLRGQLSFER